MALTITYEPGPHLLGRRLAAVTRTAARAVARAAATAARPHRKALTNLAHMPLFILGGASIDFAAFHLSHGVGWLVTGVSLIIAELAAADE